MLSAKRGSPKSVEPQVKKAQRAADPAAGTFRPSAHLDLVRVVERVHRRSLDLLRTDLARLGIDDISPSQVMMLFTIGAEELTVRDLVDRGYYLGSNASYNLKQLVETGYVDRSVSERDRRSARIRLSERGRRLCDAIQKVDDTYYRLVIRNPKEARDLDNAIKALKRIEQAWSIALRYGAGPDL